MRSYYSRRSTSSMGLVFALLAMIGIGIGMFFWIKQVVDEKARKATSRIERMQASVPAQSSEKDYDANLTLLREDMKEREKTLPIEKLMAAPTPVSSGNQAIDKALGKDENLQKYREAYKALPSSSQDEYKNLPPKIALALAQIEVEKQAALDKVKGNDAEEARVRLEYLGKALDIKKQAHDEQQARDEKKTPQSKP